MLAIAITDDIRRERGLLIPRDSNFCREKSRSTRTITRAPRIQVHSCMQHGSRGRIIRVLIITRESASRDTIQAVVENVELDDILWSWASVPRVAEAPRCSFRVSMEPFISSISSISFVRPSSHRSRKGGGWKGTRHLEKFSCEDERRFRD